ncbi:MAG: protein kinase domain-containing protein [Terracidiphilus sp.]
MGSARWREVNTWLDYGLALPESERAPWLDSIRAENPETACLLEEMLSEHRALAAEHFLEGSLATFMTGSPWVGQTVGAYTLIASIGQGGMGSVWLARRSDGRFERQVAIKFLSIAVGSETGVQRFRREGRILGQLTHPHIAELIDAGVTDRGERYLILEYVEGEPIDVYCDQRSLNVESRIRLFRDVLLAVSHAHTNLVVHRDIKPSNVLVDKDGQVKLLDFGIATLLQREGAAPAATQLTLEGGAGLTPLFASPEQISGGAITTATDVYSLGVLLFLLLTGQHPTGPGPHSPAELIRAITEKEPLSGSGTTGSSGAEARAKARATTPEKLRRQLRGDLDIIMDRALRKDPRERYPSAAAMADDLLRYLRHEPIHARPDTLLYVGTKFLRRYWAPVSTVTIVVASLAAGLYIANHERAIAEQRFAQLRQLSVQVFDLDTSIRRLPGSTEARERLVSIALKYLDGLADSVHGDPELMEEIGEGYLRVARVEGVPTDLNLGDPAKAEASLTKADEVTDRLLASRPKNASALFLSAEIANARMILAQEEHRNGEAAAQARRSADRLDACLKLGPLHGEELNTAAALYLNIGMAEVNMHSYADAIPYAHRVVEMSRAMPSPGVRTAQGLTLLSESERYEGDLDGALRDIDEAKTLVEEATYADPAGRMLDEFGVLLREGLLLGEDGAVNLGRPRDAVLPLQRAFDMAESVAEKDPRDAVSRERLINASIPLGNVLRASDPGRAMAVYDLALKRNREAGNGVIMMRKRALLLGNSSGALLRLHRYREARQRTLESLATLRETEDYPAEKLSLDSEAYVALSAWADYLAATGSLGSAIDSDEHLLSLIMAAKPATDTDLRDAPRLSRLYQSLAELDRRAGDAVRAQEMDSRRLALWEAWDRKLPGNPFIRRQLGAVLLQQ